MTVQERNKKQKQELKKLTKIYKSVLDDDDFKKIEGAIENVAFMRVSLTELTGLVKEHGYAEHYQNGENQYGTKDSTYLRAYNNLLKSYNATIKIILSVVPAAARAAVLEDDFDKF